MMERRCRDHPKNRGIVTMLTATPDTLTLSERAKQRERERTSRRRRAANLDRMRHTRDALERALIVGQTYDDVDAVWEDFLDENAMRARRFLRKSIQLTREASVLQREQALLRRLLAEHRLALRAVVGALQTVPPPISWEERVEHWRELAQIHFRPWTLEQCQVEIDAALKDVHTFMWSTDKETSGLSFLGWREQRRVVPERDLFQFQFHKTFQGHDIADFVDVGWEMYTDAKVFQEVLIGDRVQCTHEVLQQLEPDIMIIRAAERFPLVETNVHMTFLVFRVKTDRGILQCVRSISCPELMAAITGPTDLWATTSAWKQWDLLGDGEFGYKYRLGGSIVGRDTTYLNQWMFEIFGCVLRSERVATGRQLVITSD